MFPQLQDALRKNPDIPESSRASPHEHADFFVYFNQIHVHNTGTFLEVCWHTCAEMLSAIHMHAGKSRDGWKTGRLGHPVGLAKNESGVTCSEILYRILKDHYTDTLEIPGPLPQRMHVAVVTCKLNS